jgi:hypothetical protein
LKVSRRYSQFEALREALVSRFIGLYVPPLPPKNYISFNPEAQNDRTALLHKFVQNLIQWPYLLESIEWQLFMRSNIVDLP